MKNTAILLTHCPDQKGLVAAVTDFLHNNNGNIIEFTHRDSIKDLVRKGKGLEKVILSKALWLQLQHRVLPFQNKTIVF